MLRASAPTRIDLAGGTLDLHPLYQFIYPETFSTINLAIDISNTVEISPLSAAEIVIQSVDLDVIKRFENLHQLKEAIQKTSNPLQIPMRAIYYFQIEGIQITLSSKAPKGSGLGNSSSLLIAVLGALNEFTEKNISNQKLLLLAQAIETSILKIPTGSQDYIAALHGGFNKIEYELEGPRIHKFQSQKTSQFITTLLSNTLLCYTETPMRYISSLDNPNWDIFKNVIEQKDMIWDQLVSINKNVHQMTRAIQENNWDKFINCIKKEHKLRLKLSQSITTPKMKDLIDILNQNTASFGIEAYKVCGAGGGGSVLIFSTSPKELRKELLSNGFQVINFAMNKNGLQIHTQG